MDALVIAFAKFAAAPEYAKSLSEHMLRTALQRHFDGAGQVDELVQQLKNQKRTWTDNSRKRRERSGAAGGSDGQQHSDCQQSNDISLASNLPCQHSLELLNNLLPPELREQGLNSTHNTEPVIQLLVDAVLDKELGNSDGVR